MSNSINKAQKLYQTPSTKPKSCIKLPLQSPKAVSNSLYKAPKPSRLKRFTATVLERVVRKTSAKAPANRTIKTEEWFYNMFFKFCGRFQDSHAVGMLELREVLSFGV